MWPRALAPAWRGRTMPRRPEGCLEEQPWTDESSVTPDRSPGYHLSVRHGATGSPSRLYSAGAVGLLVQRYRTAAGFGTCSFHTTTRLPSILAVAQTNR